MSFTLDVELAMGKHLKVKRHHLHNGLTLISAVDKSAPILAYQTWFAVGSRNESAGSTGMAHFFEHLMFNQTKTLALGEFDRIIEATGGDSNAATWNDWTYYRNNIPAEELEMIVKLESGRMTDLVLTPEVVEAEREVVMNERLERVDDDVDGFAGEELFRHAFQSHPYHWPTIGWMSDIKSLSIPQMESFYRQYYSPDNAIIVVVGDFEEATLLSLVESHYGGISASGVQTTSLAPEPTQVQERVFCFQKEVSSPRLLNGYKSPGQGHPDWPLLMFTSSLLAGSASSPLYRKLVIEEELASSVYCDLMPFADPSLLEISVTLTRDSDLETVQTMIDDCIADIASDADIESEIMKVRNLVETEFWSGLSTMDGKAEALGHYQCIHGDFDKLFVMADTLANVSTEDVRRVTRIYLQKNQRTVIRIVPEDAPEDEVSSQT